MTTTGEATSMQYEQNCSARPRHRKGDAAHQAECVDPNQLDLLAPVDADDVPNGATLPERFMAFHRANPDVYNVLRKFALGYVAATGARRLGAQMIVEKLRYETGIQTRSDDFKLNNSFAAYYARALMACEPDLAGRFEIRRSAEADAWAAATFPKTEAA
jgi:hypothetical protein